MARLNLIIADKDTAYLESLVSFLMDKHPQKFKISFFTNETMLVDFFLKNNEKPALLLITPELYDYLRTNCSNFNDFGEKTETPIVVILCGSDISNITNGCNVIFKYQHGDKIASDLIHIYENVYCKNSCNEIDFTLQTKQMKDLHGLNKTWIVAVYSPAGGTGKTTIAVNLCIQCARLGMKVFYLNLENINSDSCFFENNINRYDLQTNISNIIFASKEKDKNLKTKIEAAKLIDPIYNINYFPPPESAFEMEEVEPEDIKFLLNGLKSAGNYDITIVDMDSFLCKRNFAVMEECDDIILVYKPAPVSRQKLLCFNKELGIYEQKNRVNLQSKLIMVVNEYDENVTDEIASDLEVICSTIGVDAYHKMPHINQSIGTKDNPRDMIFKCRVENTSGLNKGLHNLAVKYIKMEPMFTDANK